MFSLHNILKTFKTRKEFPISISISIWFLIIILSLTPLPELPQISNNDKLHHVIAYFALSLPISFSLKKYRIIFNLFFIFTGGVIEMVQPYVNRYGELLDFYANVFGVLLGFLTGLILSYLVDKKLIL